MGIICSLCRRHAEYVLLMNNEFLTNFLFYLIVHNIVHYSTTEYVFSWTEIEASLFRRNQSLVKINWNFCIKQEKFDEGLPNFSPNDTKPWFRAPTIDFCEDFFSLCLLWLLLESRLVSPRVIESLRGRVSSWKLSL